MPRKYDYNDRAGYHKITVVFIRTENPVMDDETRKEYYAESMAGMNSYSSDSPEIMFDLVDDESFFVEEIVQISPDEAKEFLEKAARLDREGRELLVKLEDEENAKYEAVDPSEIPVLKTPLESRDGVSLPDFEVSKATDES